MKKYIYLLATTLIIAKKSDAQLFEEIFGKAKQEFNSLLQKNVTRLSQQGMEYLGNQAERINIVSSKKRVDNTSSNNFIDNSNQSVSTKQTEEYLKRHYPIFFYLYSEVIQDKYINQILFVFRERSSWMVECRNGNIIFDLNQFDLKNGTSNENQRCWALLIMQGVAHQINEKPNLIGEDTEYERFNFALINSRRYAEKGHCCALRQAVTYWKNRNFGTEVNKEAARNRIIKTDYFVECESWIKSATCGKTR
jgi:hypothetical protein